MPPDNLQHGKRTITVLRASAHHWAHTSELYATRLRMRDFAFVPASAQPVIRESLGPRAVVEDAQMHFLQGAQTHGSASSRNPESFHPAESPLHNGLQESHRPAAWPHSSRLRPFAAQFRP